MAEVICWHIKIKPTEVLTKYYGNRYRENQNSDLEVQVTWISHYLMSVGGCGVITKVISLQATLLHWWAQRVDLNYSDCQGQKSALGQHTVILPSIATDYTQHLSLRRPKPSLHNRSVVDMQIEKKKVCAFHSVKRAIVPGEVYKNLLCCQFGFPLALNVSDGTRTRYMTSRFWWESGQEPVGRWRGEFGSYRGDNLPITAIRGRPDPHRLPGGKWLGTARPCVRPGTEAVVWTWRAGPGRLKLCGGVCVCGVHPEEIKSRIVYADLW